MHLRAKVVEQHGWQARGSQEAALMASLGWAFGGRRRFSLAERIAALGGRILGRGGPIRWAPGPGWLRSWLRGRDLPAPAREPFRAWWRRTGGRSDER